ncbi:hypothetical protein BDP27DRAFT_1366032 [Rhodocollybia butyracea]|uniref:F-box domain-containing protein n=1 Tax=Rhodocollybia butyracea TaxID=206335 RepID=A0A9P5PMI9_9AGAR|nr:hypothetical protein BDP27DRAFT_1366032 [Rhodocollybia butyracea]
MMLSHDVIALICAEISGRKDLLYLGLASKYWFLEPALNILWKKIDGLEPLLSVLPETTVVNGNLKVFLRSIAPSSWNRLRFYTSRVREFDSNPKHYSSIAPKVGDSVYTYLGKEKPIFPKLRTLHLEPTPCILKAFRSFLVPSLQEVSWPSGPWRTELDLSSDLGRSLARLASKSPGLKSLALCKYTYSGMSTSLRRLLALESFQATHLSHLEVDLIQALALLPRLTTLSLTFPPGVVLDYTGVEGGFPSLRKIELQGSTSDTRKFLAVARPQALESLSIDCEEDLTADEPVTEQDQSLADIAADITAITHLLSSFPLLQHLFISGDAFSSLQRMNELQLWSIFEPLLELKRLTRFVYDIGLPLSDEKTAQIACAWPHLEELTLTSCGVLSSLGSLVHFARHCPNLERLRYPIDAQLQTPAIEIPPTVSKHPLNIFWCDNDVDVMTEHAEAAALGLYQMFPNLVQVRGDGLGWGEVRDLLYDFQNPDED